MKAIYLFIVLFLAWCAISARWYMFSVKGLNTDPAHFNPHETTMAIVEILFMVLVAFLLGFAIAWLLRESAIATGNEDNRRLQTERTALSNNLQDLKSQLVKQESKLAHAQESFRQDYIATSRENERIKASLEESIKDAREYRDELLELRTRLKHADSECDLLKRSNVQQEKQIRGLEEGGQKLKTELGELRNTLNSERKKPVYSDFITDQLLVGISQVDVNEKDDLKLISGIGPGIQEKLNGQGINSFKKISELTKQSSKHISDAIKFFPGRIERDRWVEQASRLYLEKLRK